MTMNFEKQNRMSIDEIANDIAVTGTYRTVFVQGDSGSGKTSIKHILAKRFPKHQVVHCDLTNFDLGDLHLPAYKDLDGEEFIRFVANEELGLHLNKPLIICWDEASKANNAVKNVVLRAWLERGLGKLKYHPETLQFATGNLMAENMGDLFLPHQRERLTMVRMRKSSNTEHVEYGLKNDFDEAYLAWVADTPILGQSFDDIKKPEDNPYIYHPQSNADKFFTWRGGEAASNMLKDRDRLSSVTAMLGGTIGWPAAMDLMAYVNVRDDLASLEDIKKNPETAKIPNGAGAKMMSIMRALLNLDVTWIDAWMKYAVRMDDQVMAMFVNTIKSAKFAEDDTKKAKVQAMVMSNKLFSEWCANHPHLYSSDI